MPRTPKYPLAALREHRDRLVEAATVDLAEAVRAREAAEDAEKRAVDAKNEAEANAARLRAEEGERLARGVVVVADLARVQAWELALRQEQESLGDAIDAARAALVAAQDVERSAREILAKRKAELDVVLKDEKHFEHRAARARDAAEEEEASEVLAARRREG